MALSDITRDSVLAAIREHQVLGQAEFLQKYGFGPSTRYMVKFDNGLFDSKALAGAAHGYALPEYGPLSSSAFSGGRNAAAKVLEQLGFEIVQKRNVSANPDDLPKVQREHFEVASSFDGEFTTSEFKQRYAERYPDRNSNSMLPSDFSHNNEQEASDEYPSFLETVGDSVYRFVGLAPDKEVQHKNPNWTRDELILATAFYKHHAPKIPGKTDNRLIALSDEIRAVARSLGLHGDETFRNPNGVYMKLMELRKYDPEYLGKGLGRSLRQIEQEVWNLPDAALFNATRAIRASLEGIKRGLTPLEGVTDAQEPEVADAPEGALVTRLHRYRERNRKIVDDKKKQFLKKHGSLHCEACGFDFAKTYGERGQGFIECHHTVPVSEMEPGAKTKLSDLALVCANCHRMIHGKRPWLKIDGVRELLNGDKPG